MNTSHQSDIQRKTERLKKTSETPTPLSPKITMEAWIGLVHNLKLKPDQTCVLQEIIRGAVDQLARFEETRMPKKLRALLTKRLEQLERAFKPLLAEVNRSPDLLIQFLPSDLLEHIGNLLTFTAIGDALGQKVFPSNAGIIKLRAKKEELTVAALEECHASQRRSLGLKNGDVILKYLIQSLYSPLANWVKLNKLNKGGRPADLSRQYLIWRLAEAAPEIIGKPAPIARSGAFVDLCEQVMLACGLSGRGIEWLAEEIVGKMRDRRDLPPRNRKRSS
jgi:hypothetical protein